MIPLANVRKISINRSALYPKKRMQNKINPKSLLIGVFLGAVILATIGAAAGFQFVKEVKPVRFLVLEVTPKGERTGLGVPVQLKLSPHYGKITKEGLDFRFKNETQELLLLTYVDEGYQIKRGDILTLQVSHHLKPSPGSVTYRHFPGGGEGVP